jgi:hypothetical protein
MTATLLPTRPHDRGGSGAPKAVVAFHGQTSQLPVHPESDVHDATMKTPPICANWLIPILVCTFGLAASTLVTYSQDNQTPLKGAEVAGIALPAENVEITDIRGRTITVTVTGRDANGITIKTADGIHYHLVWRRLSKDTVDLFKIEAPERTIRKPKKQPINPQFLEENNPIFEKFRKLPAKELHQMILDQPQKNDPEIAIFIESFKLHLENVEKRENWYSKDPHWRKFNLNYFDIAHLMEIKDADVEERVSLRPEFERLGVKAREQEKNLCTMYSAQHLGQYLFLSKEKRPPTIAELKARVAPMWNWNTSGGSTPCEYLIKALEQKMGNRINVVWIQGSPSIKLTYEVAKHQLRNGHPIRAQVWETIGSSGGWHVVVIVGFHSKNGRTTWEALNSNHTSRDGGYTTYDAISEGFSAWFE